MATQSTNIPGSGYGNVYLDSLIWGGGWINTGTPIRYWFGSGAVPADDSSIGAFTGAAWTAGEKAAFEHALDFYSAICNLTFVEATSGSSSDTDIVWWLANESAMGGPGSLGLHEVPDASWSPIYGYFNYQDSSWQSLDAGGYGFITVIHEIGHGLGLAHPHDGGDAPDATKFPGVKGPFNSLGTGGLNQGIWTTMSYNDGWNMQKSSSEQYGWQATPMAFDVAALQTLYGANMTTATGDDVYHLPDTLGAGTYWSCIWDAGGNDTISNSGSGLACTIDLNAATLTKGTGTGGFVSWDVGIPGGYTIAHNVVIENAIGGSGNDKLVGNAAGNVLDGGGGNDTMTGGAGDDIYYVNSAGDKVTELSGRGLDTVHSTINLLLANNVENLVLETGAGAINGTGNALANTITGNESNNLLNGGNGNDTLVGGAGVDTLTGGKGVDVFVFLSADDTGVGLGMRDIITDFKATQSDKLDMSAIDAISSTGSDDAFTYIGTAAFSAAGQLHFQGGVLSGDVDGDGTADFEIQLNGVTTFTGAGLIL